MTSNATRDLMASAVMRLKHSLVKRGYDATHIRLLESNECKEEKDYLSQMYSFMFAPQTIEDLEGDYDFFIYIIVKGGKVEYRLHGWIIAGESLTSVEGKLLKDQMSFKENPRMLVDYLETKFKRGVQNSLNRH